MWYEKRILNYVIEKRILKLGWQIIQREQISEHIFLKMSDDLYEKTKLKH